MNLTGDFLISIPSINTGSFNRSVVLMSDHTGDGAHGWIVNKQLDDKIAQTYKENFSETNVIVGDITKKEIKDNIYDNFKDKKYI